MDAGVSRLCPLPPLLRRRTIPHVATSTFGSRTTTPQSSTTSQSTSRGWQGAGLVLADRGRLEGEEDAENLEELLFSAFEAGASLAHDHPEELRFDWVTDDECERQRQAEEKGNQRDDARKERTSLSHYA